jgi:hypothetical protein
MTLSDSLLRDIAAMQQCLLPMTLFAASTGRSLNRLRRPKLREAWVAHRENESVRHLLARAACASFSPHAGRVWSKRRARSNFYAVIAG